MNPFSLDIEWFRLFYLLAIALGGILVIRAARRDGLPLSSTLVLFLWTVVFGILGSRLAEFSSQDWLDFLQTGLVVDVGKTALGGILGSMMGLALGKWVMQLKAPVWGWFMAWPVVLIVFRMGCLLAGCCVGTPTGLPWALTYPAGTPACDIQHAHAIWGADTACSLPVHPVPIYEMLFGGLLLLLMIRQLRRGMNRQMLFFLSILAYSMFRFGEEFIRPEHASASVLNSVQWALLLAMPILAWLVWKHRVPKPIPAAPLSRIHMRILSIASPLVMVFLFRNAWTTGEYLALGMLVFAFGSVKLVAFFRNRELGEVRWIAPGSLVIGLFLMSQAAIDQTVGEDAQPTWIEVGTGVAGGSYRETCGGVHKYASFGAGGQFTKNWSGNHQIESGVRGYYASDNKDSLHNQIFGGNPYFAYQNRYIGAEVGAHFGQLLTNGVERNFFPEAALRLGPSDIFFAEGRLFNNGYFPVPGSTWRIGIGSGFGLKNGTVFRAGMSAGGIYVNPTIVFSQNFMLEPMAAYGDKQTYQFGLGMRMKLIVKSEK